MSSNVENTEAQQADEAGLTVFRYKLKPIRDDQWGVIQQSLGCQRWVYNQGVALQKQRMNEGENAFPTRICASHSRVGRKTRSGWARAHPKPCSKPCRG